MPKQGTRHIQKPSRRSGGNRPPGGPALGLCPEAISKGRMQAISAPYNFVPLAGWVHIPEWGRQVSHDLPFRDGYSGEIAYRLVAESPLLVGGHQQTADENNPGVVRPFRLPDGRYAIPGSSLKGMLRAAVEIAGFGRMRMVDDQRPGLRDITGSFVAQSYTAKVRNQVGTGFLRQRPDGGQQIIPCKMVRLDHRDLETALDVSAPIFKKRLSVAKKYRHWKQLCGRRGWDPGVLTFDVQGLEAKRLNQGDVSGTPVFTGQISDSTKPRGKHRDFVFYDPDENGAIAVPDSAWRDFLRIHGHDEKGGRAKEMSWPGHWKRIHRNGGQVPVFFLQDGELLRIGLAYMPKLAGDFSVHEMIGHSSTAHLRPPGYENGYDFADLLFGAINGENQNDALRGRVSCETALAEGEPTAEPHPVTILNGPKPTYFPSYVTQEAHPGTWKLKSGQYATYIETQQSRQPTLRGFKRYPARPEGMTGVQELTKEQEGNKKVQVRLHALPKGATFAGRIVFHNLKPEELGALVWVLTWEGDEKLRHGLGMGKPFGFGQVRFRLDLERSRLIPNDPASAETAFGPERLGQLMEAFVSHMEEAAKDRGGWVASAQLANLLAMADPDAAQKLPAGVALRHMLLMRCQRDRQRENLNEFQWAKQQPPGPFVLADYAIATGRTLPGSGGGAPAPDRGARAAPDLHTWVREIVTELMQAHKSPEDEVMRGKALAEKWAGIDDAETKAAALASIRAYWKHHGWWAEPPGKAAKRAKGIYGQGA